MSLRLLAWAGCLCVLAAAEPAHALRWDLSERITLDWENKLSTGLQIRTQSPSRELIGKASLPGNRGLCAADDCISVDPDDTEPNARFLAAPGATAMFTDDGNLNYDKYDLTAATNKWLSSGTLRLGDRGGVDNLQVQFGWLGYYDPVNVDFQETRPNQIVEPGPQPGRFVREERNAVSEEELGRDLELRELSIGFRAPFIGSRELGVKIGRQLLSWGEGTVALRGSLNFINPPAYTNLLRPGFELTELYRPVNMAVFDTQLTRNVSAEAFYQFEWRPYLLPPKGGLVSFFDASNEVAADDAIPLPFGKTPDDPNQLGTPANDTAALVTDTSFAGARGPNREPEDGGQYGLRINWFTDAIGENGADIGFYYANYHSRIPLVGATATDASCARREGNPLGIDAGNVADFFLACGVNPTGPQNGETLTQRNALPLDTATYFLDYPEDIHVFGLSYNTLLGGWAMQGEFAFRPNLPVQVDIEDILFAAFQPSFPRDTIPLIPDAVDSLDPGNACNNLDALGALAPVCGAIAGTQENLTDALGVPTLEGLGGATLAGSQRALPDFVTAYRGGTPGEIRPGQDIRGYERMENLTTSFNFTRLLGGSDAPFGADQFVFLFDVATSWLPNLPDTNELQFEAQGTLTHASPGIAETGDALKINPVQTTDGFVTEFAWGYRVASLLTYQDVPWSGAQLVPTIALFHDVDGVSPGLAANFIEDRKILFLDLELQSGNWAFNATQTIFAGGGTNNVLTDRDNLSLAISYEF